MAFCAVLTCLGLAVPRADVPPRKLALIRQSLAAMQLDQKLQGLVDARVQARAQKIRIENPEAPGVAAGDSLLPDSVFVALRGLIAEVYASHRSGRDGLDMQVYAVFDRSLTEEDLKFITNFNASDRGKRYRELIPRIIAECVQVGQAWSERLEPELRSRILERFRSLGLKL